MVYGARLELGKRDKANVYTPTQKKGENCMKLILGHWHPVTDRLVAWKSGFEDLGENPSKEICVANKTLSDQLFDQTKWPKPEQPQAEERDDLEGPSDGSRTARSRFVFTTNDDCLCHMTMDKNSKELEPITLASFCIPKILAIYQFVEAGEAPMMKLLCRKRLAPPRADGTDSVVHVRAEDSERAPSLNGATLLEVEVIVYDTLLKSPQEVKQAFASVHSLLKTDSLTPEMLSCYLNSIPFPLPSAVIVRWGLQPSGWFVMHNAAFKNGVIQTVEGSGHAIAPEFFKRNVHCPMPVNDFPRMTIIPFPHVRYAIGINMWNYQMPSFFQNNELPAKVRPP